MNEPLRTGCPCCSGTGKVSWLRTGEWINTHCPGRNGPCDVDSSIDTHELDHYQKKRKVRIEYKRKNEPVRAGQEMHIRAEHESVAKDWRALTILVWDEGQQGPDDEIEFAVWDTKDNFVRYSEQQRHRVTVGRLGKRIANFLWPPPIPR